MAEIESEHGGAVAYVRLNRPDVRNALSLSLIEALTSHVAELSAHADVRVIVLSGNGKHFCAGADLTWMQASAQLDQAGNLREAAILGQLFATIDNSPKAVIADVTGAAIGGGAGLVAVCDYAIATNDALFRFSEVRLGLIPAVISPFVLAKIGASAARAYFTSGEAFNAQRALELGLIHESISHEERSAAVQRIIDAYLACAPGAIAASKQLLHKLIHEPLPSATETAAFTAEAIAKRRISIEAQQGVAAFLTREKAPWLI